jgi:hypothetical protein
VSGAAQIITAQHNPEDMNPQLHSFDNFRALKEFCDLRRLQ